MWRIVKVQCENFISFREAELWVPGGGCTLIYGINNDNVKQKNNGTGKSSIIEAIAFGLTGEPLRAVDKTEEIINDASETAHVCLELANDYDMTVLVIDRTISRSAAQIIECHKYDEFNCEIEQDKTSQPTVLDYNRYILDEIGLTKDDIYSNFILSKNKYKSFFDAGDKAKKAMINRFSGADMVDQSIEALQIDMKPVEEAVVKAHEDKIAVDAKIEVVENQLADLANKESEWAATQEAKIADLQGLIAKSRENIRMTNDSIQKANERLNKIDSVGNKIEDLENLEFGLAPSYDEILALLKDNRLAEIKDYRAMSEESANAIKDAKTKLGEYEESQSKYEAEIADCQKSLDKAQKDYDSTRKQYDKQNADSKSILDDINNDIAKTREKIREQRELADDINDAIRRINHASGELQNQLYGVITCPQCSHKFFIKSDKSVEDVETEIADLKTAKSENDAQLDKANKTLERLSKDLKSYNEERDEEQKIIDGRAAHLREISISVSQANNALDDILQRSQNRQRVMSSLKAKIESEQVRIDSLIRSMFDEAYGIIDDAMDRGETYIKSLKDSIATDEAAITAFQQSIEQVKNASQADIFDRLNKSKAEHEKELRSAILKLEKAQSEYDRYVVQENRFIEFRSYLANKKVEAISAVTNHFLELIGSDLRVEMLGFKKLKNGKIRDKITVNLLRDGILCGSYARHSGGERARVNLASILGLQTLTNMSAPKGKGLDILVLDEILSESDSAGIESISKALNDLHVTSLLVTQDTIVDHDGKVILVTKENGISTINKDR